MALTSSAYITCLCGAISEPGTLLSDSEIPILTEICHCNTCRYTTGSLGAPFPSFKSPPSQATLSRLTAYSSSQVITRYFCTTCGCHCFVYNDRCKQWYCLGGTIEPSSSNKETSTTWPEDTVKISHHIYVLDTLDGGLTPILLNLSGRSIPTWSAGQQKPLDEGLFDLPHATILSLPRKAAGNHPRPEDGTYLEAKCHCGGVFLLIKRADYSSHSNPEVSARYISSNSDKYLTYLCACRSCRLSTGVSLTPWTLIPPENIFNANAPSTNNDLSLSPDQSLVPLTFGYPTKTSNTNPGLDLKHHWSSPDVCRSFCGGCGATVFYWCGQRPDELDIAVGIMRSEDGSMARDWLNWEWGRCSSTEESIDREISNAWSQSAAVMNKIGASDG